MSTLINRPYIVCCERADIDGVKQPPYLQQCGCPSVDKICSSLEKNAALCGYPEFTDISIPPKSYFKKVVEDSEIGTVYTSATFCLDSESYTPVYGEGCANGGEFQIFDACDGESIEYCIVGDIDKNYSIGTATQQTASSDILTTTSVYDDDCVESSETVSDIINGAPQSADCSVSGGFTGGTTTDEVVNIVPTNESTSQISGSKETTTTAYDDRTVTTKQKDGFSGLFCIERKTFSFPDEVSHVNTYKISKTLSIPDSEADALTRAIETEGTSCSSLSETRTDDFVFTVRTSSYALKATGLQIDAIYTARVEIESRPAIKDPDGSGYVDDAGEPSVWTSEDDKGAVMIDEYTFPATATEMLVPTTGTWSDANEDDVIDTAEVTPSIEIPHVVGMEYRIKNVRIELALT